MENEAPLWVTYGVDALLLLVFLFILLFIKPAPPAKEDEDDQAPNPLEKMLVTDDEAETISDENQSEESDAPENEQKKFPG